MSLLMLPSKVRSSKARPSKARPARSPLPPPVQLRVQLSADLVSALLEVEGLQHATLDDLEWADAVAARMAARQARRANEIPAGDGS